MSEPTERKPAERKSFWSTVPGLLTAIAAIVTATATLVTALVAAAVIGPHKATPTPVRVAGTAASVALPSPDVRSSPASGVLFEDTFTNPGSGWDIYTDSDVETGYVNDEYRVAVFNADMTGWGTPSGAYDWANFAVEVDARQLQGPLDSAVGLLARYQPDGQNYYRFSISADGYYLVDIFRAGQWVTLVESQSSPAIRQGLNQVNRLRVVCDRSKLSFYANDALLSEVIDNTFASGKIGLSVGTYDEGGAVVHFDNLRVTALGQT